MLILQSNSTHRVGASSRREHIVSVAAELFAQQGFAGVGMRQVAKSVGLSKSALFHHFPTKLALYTAVLLTILADLDDRLQEAWQPNDDEMRQLERWLEVVIDALAENPAYAPLLLRTLFEKNELESVDEEHSQRMQFAILGRLYDLLKRGMASGRFRRVSASHTVQTLIGMVIYHFASAEYGERLFGESVFSAVQVGRRKQHILTTMRRLLCDDE